MASSRVFVRKPALVDYASLLASSHEHFNVMFDVRQCTVHFVGLRSIDQSVPFNTANCVHYPGTDEMLAGAK